MYARLASRRRSAAAVAVTLVRVAVTLVRALVRVAVNFDARERPDGDRPPKLYACTCTCAMCFTAAGAADKCYSHGQLCYAELRRTAGTAVQWLLTLTTVGTLVACKGTVRHALRMPWREVGWLVDPRNTISPVPARRPTPDIVFNWRLCGDRGLGVLGSLR